MVMAFSACTEHLATPAAAETLWLFLLGHNIEKFDSNDIWI